MSTAPLITTPYLPPARPLLISGEGGLPKLLLRARDGAGAEVYLHGGQVTSWRPAGDGEERLFLSSTAQFREGGAIRGGVPVIFPQFGEGRLPRHGFARGMEWGLLAARETEAGAATVTLQLTDGAESWAQWRHRFSLELTVTVQGQTLELRLRVANEGRKAFRFSGALHGYLRLRELAEASLLGLQGCAYRDAGGAAGDSIEQAERLCLSGALDRVYRGAPAQLRLQEANRGLDLLSNGFPDLVVWNPGPVGAAYLADLEPGGDRRMLCVEPAVVAEPVLLQPGESWTGSQRLIA